MITSRTFDNTIVVATHGNGMYSNKMYDPLSVIETKHDEWNINYFPNPFNSGVTRSLTGEIKGEVVAEVFDITGRIIRKLKVENTSAITWDGKDFSNHNCPTGTYLIKITTNSKMAVKKVIKQEQYLLYLSLEFIIGVKQNCPFTVGTFKLSRISAA